MEVVKVDLPMEVVKVDLPIVNIIQKQKIFILDLLLKIQNFFA